MEVTSHRNYYTLFFSETIGLVLESIIERRSMRYADSVIFVVERER